jgi:hypothetical protein
MKSPNHARSVFCHPRALPLRFLQPTFAEDTLCIARPGQAVLPYEVLGLAE